MRSAINAFNASVVDLFACALLAMLVLWITSMGAGQTVSPAQKPILAISLAQELGHFDEIELVYGNARWIMGGGANAQVRFPINGEENILADWKADGSSRAFLMSVVRLEEPLQIIAKRVAGACNTATHSLAFVSIGGGFGQQSFDVKTIDTAAGIIRAEMVFTPSAGVSISCFNASDTKIDCK